MVSRAPSSLAEYESPADRRSSTAVARLCAGIFLLYQRATGASESSPFIRDEKSWAAFEQAALPEMQSFTFVDRTERATRTPASVLADVMGDVWLAESLSYTLGTPTTIQVVTALANRIDCAYQISPIQRRARNRHSLGINVLA